MMETAMSQSLENKIQYFCSNLENLISISRLSSYEDKYYHQDNLQLIANITPKIALLELSLRNIIDFALKNIKGENWLELLKNTINNKNRTDFEEKLLAEIKKIEKKYIKHALSPPTQNQYVSSLTLGTWIKIADEFRICYALFNPHKLNFCHYGGKYNNRQISRAQKRWKIIYAINLLLIIRNKAYHWENLLKLNKNGNPNITYRYSKNFKLIASIEPKMLNVFLEDFLKTINPKLMELETTQAKRLCGEGFVPSE